MSKIGKILCSSMLHFYNLKRSGTIWANIRKKTIEWQLLELASMVLSTMALGPR